MRHALEHHLAVGLVPFGGYFDAFPAAEVLAVNERGAFRMSA